MNTPKNSVFALFEASDPLRMNHYLFGCLHSAGGPSLWSTLEQCESFQEKQSLLYCRRDRVCVPAIPGE
jgi:hypothetical protein